MPEKPAKDELCWCGHRADSHEDGPCELCYPRCTDYKPPRWAHVRV